jgi:hypothetical protein
MFVNSKEEFVKLWVPRLVGVGLSICLDGKSADLAAYERLTRKMAGCAYDSITDPNYRDPKKRFEMYEKLGKLWHWFSDLFDDENFLPASKLLDWERCPDFNAIRKELRRNPQIKTRRPRQNRLLVHAADWLRAQGKPAIDPLDLSASAVDAALTSVDEIERRKDEERSRRLG